MFESNTPRISISNVIILSFSVNLIYIALWNKSYICALITFYLSNIKSCFYHRFGLPDTFFIAGQWFLYLTSILPEGMPCYSFLLVLVHVKNVIIVWFVVNL
jgi:hypothetical protein